MQMGMGWYQSACYRVPSPWDPGRLFRNSPLSLQTSPVLRMAKVACM